MIKRYFTSLMAFICIAKLQAQSVDVFFNTLQKEISLTHLVSFNKMRLLVLNQNYISAALYLDTLQTLYPNSQRLNFVAGLCSAYHLKRQDKSIALIKQAEPLQAEISNYYYYLAYAYEVNDSLEAAKRMYLKAFEVSKQTKYNDTYYQDILQTKLRQVENQINFKNKRSTVTVRNMGQPINTKASEYVPLMPADKSKLYFTYRGELSKGGKQILNRQKWSDKKTPEQGLFFEDIYFTNTLNDSVWSVPQPLAELNTNLHDAAVSISSDGTQLFIYKNTGLGSGDLFMSKWDGKRWRTPIYQQGLNSKEWDGSACFLPDNKHVIISSERKGGFGGRDLYIAEQIGENRWGNIKNLGPVVNSKNDEDAPFVTSDGKILFFAGNGKKSLGGYDIMRSDKKDSVWTEPYNVGEPINTKYDDKFFIVSVDGKQAYYSSQRADGFGEQDIYRAEPAIPGKPIALVQVGGYVTVNEKPTEAFIEVRSLTKRNGIVAQSLSDKVSGRFTINVPAGDEYEVIFNHKKFPPQIKEISTTAVDSFIAINMIADFYSLEVNEKLALKRDSAIKSLTTTNTISDLDNYILKYANLKVTGLVYKVQVGAFKFFENFNYTNVLGFPKILRQVGSDGITRFTMGGFETIEEAKALLDRVREKSLKEAFIIATYQDERYYLQELVKKGIVK